MDKSKNQILTEKSICLLRRKQYSFEVHPELTKTELKIWIEQFFDIKVGGINSCRIPHKKRRINSTVNSLTSKRSKKMIVRLRGNFTIPLFLNQPL
uniref:Large ribosomal subunit protein uL23c n=1 Tax=Lindsaea linearis TaxID=641179 RepID=A0A5B9RE07_9MONI|nr:ribosomal protein L23 [Lindsaea linearis]QEG57390.1 ribosomal protein L23 [Lindsaea linearis]